MWKLTCYTLLGSPLALATAITPAQAQVIVQTPWSNVQVGPLAQPRVVVQTPWVTIMAGRTPPPPVGQPVAPPPVSAPTTDATYVPGAPPPVPLPIPVVPPVATRPLTLNAFAASFQPKGGHYEVDIEHPVTGQPVHVSFTLPEGTPRRVKVHRLELEFDYGRQDVVIRFPRDGSVRVRY